MQSNELRMLQDELGHGAESNSSSLCLLKVLRPIEDDLPLKTTSPLKYLLKEGGISCINKTIVIHNYNKAYSFTHSGAILPGQVAYDFLPELKNASRKGDGGAGAMPGMGEGRSRE